MHIKNANKLPIKKRYFNGIIGNWLIEQGIPLLFREGNKCVFAETDELKKKLEKIPFYFKLFNHV
jgi:hypothetical protein